MLLIIILLFPIQTKYEWFIDGELVATDNEISFPKGDECNICYCNILGMKIYKIKYEIQSIDKYMTY